MLADLMTKQSFRFDGNKSSSVARTDHKQDEFGLYYDMKIVVEKHILSAENRVEKDIGCW